MKLFKRIFAALLTGAMLLSFTACSDTSWVYDYNGEKLPSGLYIANTMAAYTQAQSAEGIDTKKDLFKQKIENVNAKDWIINKAKSYCDSYIAIENKFKELNLTLTDEQTKAATKDLDGIWEQVGAIYEKNGVSRETYYKSLLNQQKNEAIFQKFYGKDGLEEVSVDKLKSHFSENYASINIFAMYAKTGTSLSDEDKKFNNDLKATADKYVEEINNGTKTFNKVRDEYAVLSGSSKEATKDADLKKDEDTKTYAKKDGTTPTEKVVKAIFNEMKTDEQAKVIADGDNYYVVVRYDAMKDDKNFEDMRDNVLYDIKNDEFTKKMEDWVKALKPTANSAAINRYNPKNIKFDLGE